MCFCYAVYKLVDVFKPVFDVEWLLSVTQCVNALHSIAGNCRCEHNHDAPVIWHLTGMRVWTVFFILFFLCFLIFYFQVLSRFKSDLKHWKICFVNVLPVSFMFINLMKSWQFITLQIVIR